MLAVSLPQKRQLFGIYIEETFDSFETLYNFIYDICELLMRTEATVTVSIAKVSTPPLIQKIPEFSLLVVDAAMLKQPPPLPESQALLGNNSPAFLSQLNIQLAILYKSGFLLA